MASAAAASEHGVEVLHADVALKLSNVYGAGPPGRFLRGRHGVTHFRLEEPVPQPAERKVAVLAHGVGTSNALFDGMVTSLWKAGYTTLRFDFLGHGWSVADELWIRYDKDVFLAQLEDLLLHVLGPAGTVACFVGHSTGGALGVYAAACLRWKMDDLVLVSPCLWKHAPLLVRVGDAMPEALWRLLQFSLVQKLNLPANAYLENCDTAFGKGADGKYVHPDAHAKSYAWNQKLLKAHPHLVPAIVGISNFFFRDDLLPGLRTAFAEAAAKPGPRISLLWGKLDTVVPFSHADEAVKLGPPGRITLLPLEKLGHEAIFEDAASVCRAMESVLLQRSKL